jgi:hypothetical protein
MEKKHIKNHWWNISAYRMLKYNVPFYIPDRVNVYIMKTNIWGKSTKMAFTVHLN